jgi:hypothetical protein
MTSMMKFPEPFAFWAIQPDGDRAYQAYEHVHSYYEGASIQYARIYELWQTSSAIKDEGNLAAVARIKKLHMQQVVRDIHCLLVFLQVIWKTLQVMSDANLYPHFQPLTEHLPLSVDWGDAGWENFRSGLKVRHRLAHPKSGQDLVVSDEELVQIRRGHAFVMSIVYSQFARALRWVAAIEAKTLRPDGA